MKIDVLDCNRQICVMNVGRFELQSRAPSFEAVQMICVRVRLRFIAESYSATFPICYPGTASTEPIIRALAYPRGK